MGLGLGLELGVGVGVGVRVRGPLTSAASCAPALTPTYWVHNRNLEVAREWAAARLLPGAPGWPWLRSEVSGRALGQAGKQARQRGVIIVCPRGRARSPLSHQLSRSAAPSGSIDSPGRACTPSKSERRERSGALSNESAEQPGRIAEACTSAMSFAARADAYLGW